MVVRLNSRQKLFIVSGVFIAAGLVVVYWGIWLPLRDLSDIRSALISSKKESRIIAQQKSLIGLLEKQFEEIEPQRKVFEKAVLPAGDLVEFIATLETLAQTSGVHIEILPQAQTRAGKEGFAFQLGLKGAHINTLRFIDELQNLIYFVETESISMRRVSEKQAGREVSGFVVSEGDAQTAMKIFVPTK